VLEAGAETLPALSVAKASQVLLPSTQAYAPSGALWLDWHKAK
jgi:hypothetical protein